MRVVIIGGAATGPKVAARLRRLKPDIDITIIEQGEYVSYGACGFPLYLEKLVPDFDELRSTTYGVIRDSQFFANHKEVKVLINTKALRINRVKKEVLVRTLTDEKEYSLAYDYLVLATGATPIIPNLPGISLKGVFALHSPHDVMNLRTFVTQNKASNVVVIGAGLIGLEAADALAGGKRNITICELKESLLPKLLDTDMAKLIEAQILKRGINIKLGCKVEGLVGDEEGNLQAVKTDSEEIKADVVVMSVGVKPNTLLAQEAGLEVGPCKGLKVNNYLQTIDPYIYAAGDCIENIHGVSGKVVYTPLASTANKQGRTVANNIAGLSEEFGPILGTSVLQIFDLNVGRTGLGEEEAREVGYEVISGITTGLDSTHFYPMHSSISIKLIANKSSGKLLGAQICGEGESIKRLDVYSTALRFGAKLIDITGLDLGYAPPFSTAIDPGIHAASALENKRVGLVSSLKPMDVIKLVNTLEKNEISQGISKKICFVDVREEEEIKANPFLGFDSIHIPIGELRLRMREISQDAVIITVCELGIRGYEAAINLGNSGFKEVYYLEGGMSTWSCYHFHN